MWSALSRRRSRSSSASAAASASASPARGSGEGGDAEPCCCIEVFEQHSLHRGSLLVVPQLLQGRDDSRAGQLSLDRVCSWLSVDLLRNVSSVFTQHWRLGSMGLWVQLVPFSEERVREEGSPFRNGVRLVVCCDGEELLMDVAARIQRLCPAEPVCRALTHGLSDMSSGTRRSQECAARRAEIWTIIEQLQNVVRWTEQASKKCSNTGKDVNSECLVLAYDLLLGLALGTDSLERLDATRDKQRPEYNGVRTAISRLNLHVARLFHDVQVAEAEGEEEEDNSTLYTDMLHVAARILSVHVKVVGELAGSCLPVVSGGNMADCNCTGRRPTPSTTVLAAHTEAPGQSHSSCPASVLPPFPPEACQCKPNSETTRAKEWDRPRNMAQSVQVSAQMDQLWRSTHHM